MPRKLSLPVDVEFKGFEWRFLRGRLKIAGEVSFTFEPPPPATGRIETEIGGNVQTRPVPGTPAGSFLRADSFKYKIWDACNLSFQAVDTRIFQLIQNGIMSSRAGRTSQSLWGELTNIFSLQASGSICRGVITVTGSTADAALLRDGYLGSVTVNINGNQLVESLQNEFFIATSQSADNYEGYSFGRTSADGRARQIDGRFDAQLSLSLQFGFTSAALLSIAQAVGSRVAGSTATAAAGAVSSGLPAGLLVQLAIEVLVGVAEMPTETTARAIRDVQINWFVQGYIDQVFSSLSDPFTIRVGTNHTYNQGGDKALADIASLGSVGNVLTRLAGSDHYGTDDRQTLINRISFYLRHGNGSLSDANILAGNYHY